MYLADIYKGREVFSEVRDLCSMMMRHSDNKEVCSAQRARGNLKGGLTYIAFGEGPPLVVFPGLGPSNANPTGVLLRFEMGWLSPLARTFTVYRINRMVGLAPDTTMADPPHYATAIEDMFEGAIAILGFSTGGSIAQRFAADRPDLVHRLVLAGTACRLGRWHEMPKDVMHSSLLRGNTGAVWPL